MQSVEQLSYKELVKAIGIALNEGRNKAFRAVNIALVKTNWLIGRYIVEYEQKGKERAEYGTELLDRLSRDLTIAYGKGFSRSNIIYSQVLFVLSKK